MAILAWYLVGFGPWLFDEQRQIAWDSRLVLPGGTAWLTTVLTGAACGGVVAGLITHRLPVAVVVAPAAGAGGWLLNYWLLQRRQLPASASIGDPRQLYTILIALLVTGGIAGVVGALGARHPVAGALAVAVPVARYVLYPATLIDPPSWSAGVSTVLVTAGLAMLLYVACWRTGWRAVPWWPLVAAGYLAGFGLITVLAVTPPPSGGPMSTVGHSDGGLVQAVTDAFVGSFGPLLHRYWGSLVIGLFLAVMLVALQIRVTLPPPKPPQQPVVDAGPNDAMLKDSDWIQRPEPRRRFLPGVG